MKDLLKIILIASLSLSSTCSSRSQTTTQNKSINSNENTKAIDLNQAALKKLYEVIAKENKTAELKNDEILVAQTKIKVAANPENELSRDGQWIFAAKFDTKIFDTTEKTFTIGSIGIGQDKNDAVETALNEWIGLFGISLSKLFSTSKPELSVDNFAVFSGLMGIRGEKPSESWIDGSPEMSKKIITSLIPFIKKSNEKITSVNLLLTADETGITSGECRINNEISQEVFEELKKLNWKSKNPFMFKQFYLIKKN